MKFPPFNVKSKRSVLLGVLGLSVLGLVAALLALQFGGWRPLASKSDQKLDEFTTVAKKEKLELKVKASGSITPRQTVNLSPKSSGKVAQILVEQGDFVTEGQVVARMDASDLEPERDQVLANLEEARVRLAQVRNPTRSELRGQADSAVVGSKAAVSQSESDINKAIAEISNADGEVVSAEGAVVDAQSALEFAQIQLKRQENLVNDGAIARNTFEDFQRREKSAQLALVQARSRRVTAQAKRSQSIAQRESAIAQNEKALAQVASDELKRDQQDQTGSSGDIAIEEARVATAQARLDAVNQKIKDTEIRAPFAGQVTQRFASVGAFVTPTTQASSATTGSGATSTSIVAISSELEVIAKVPEIDIAQIKATQAADVSVDTFPGETFKGRVRLISPEAIEERDVRFFQVRLKLVSGQRQLKSGMNADLDFAGPTSEAILVPTVAIVTKKGKPGVLVPDKDGKPIFKPVTVGNTQSGRMRSKRKKTDSATNVASGGKQADAKPDEKPKEEDKTQGKTQVIDGLNEGDRVFVKLPDGVKLTDLVKDDKDKK